MQADQTGEIGYYKAYWEYKGVEILPQLTEIMVNHEALNI